MLPHPSPMLNAAGGASYIGQTNSTSATTLSFPVGTAAGQLAILIAQSNADVAGWTKTTEGNAALFWKLLTAADVSSPPAIATATNWGLVVYSGPLRVEIQSQATDGGLPIELPGFTKDAGPAIVSIARVQNASLSTPSNFTSRQNGVAADGFYSIYAADLLSPSLYTSGATISWAGSSGGGSIQAAIFGLELI